MRQLNRAYSKAYFPDVEVWESKQAVQIESAHS